MEIGTSRVAPPTSALDYLAGRASDAEQESFQLQALTANVHAAVHKLHAIADLSELARLQNAALRLARAASDELARREIDEDR